ncbi:EthD domain-containing protein [Pontitalea aquivivens]|jgi:hypothetical protein|uniref:EthD domain-containing protein n=1 Tax=Pontitalea aquivivens TaxID=3388663 RepID=UPI00397081DC
MANMFVTKRHIMLGKKSGMEMEDFHAHWSGPHVIHVIPVSGAQRYVQCHVSRILWRSTEQMAHIAGFVELDYGTPEALRAVKVSMGNRRALLEDEANFLGWWSGSEAESAFGQPFPSQRRAIGILHRPEEEDAAAFRGKVRRFVAEMQAHCSCYAEEALTREAREYPPLEVFDWPDFYVYCDPARPSELADVIREDGPFLTGLKKLTPYGGAFLVRAEAKLMPGEKDAPYWTEG